MARHAELRFVAFLFALFLVASSAAEVRSRSALVSVQEPTQQRTWINKVGMEFVLIPSGRFRMGSTNGGSNEKPVHKVTISQPFYMGRYEVTQGQWQAVMGSNPSKFKDCGANCPVEQVSWSAAQDFITKLNEANDGYTYRLPSEAEWEYACRGGTTGDYYGNVDDIGWYAGNSGRKTHAVGGKQPNAFGLYDMSGNVWEWCVDFYHGNYHGAPTDGSAWVSGGDPIPYRVLRGGSWDDDASSLRSANRIRLTPAYRDYSYGVRVVAVRLVPTSARKQLEAVYRHAWTLELRSCPSL